jgi:hypothetical protein
MRKSILVLLVLIAQIKAFSQIEAGAFLGVSAFNGDIDVTIQNVMPQLRPAFGLYGRYYLSPSWAVRAQLFRGQLFGDEKKHPSSSYRATRGFSFTSPITEVSVQGEWHILKFDNTLRLTDDDPFISFYGLGGFGGSFFNPKTNFNEPNPIHDDVSADKNASYSKNALALIGGGGAKMSINQNLSVGLEISARKSMSDYLDGISKLAGKAKDYYFFGGITLGWTFSNDAGLVGKGGWKRRTDRHSGCPMF